MYQTSSSSGFTYSGLTPGEHYFIQLERSIPPACEENNCEDSLRELQFRLLSDNDCIEIFIESEVFGPYSVIAYEFQSPPNYYYFCNTGFTIQECDHISFLDCNGLELTYGGNLVSIVINTPSGNTIQLNNSTSAAAGFSPSEPGIHTVTFYTATGDVLCSFPINVLGENEIPDFSLTQNQFCSGNELIAAISCSNCSSFAFPEYSIDGVFYQNLTSGTVDLSGLAYGPHEICFHGTVCNNDQVVCLPFYIQSQLSFTYTLNNCNTVSFQNTSTCPNSISTWIWSFGDGSTYNGNNPTHTYTFPGTYTVTLSGITTNGQTLSTSQTITITIPPAIIIQGPENQCCGEMIFSVPAGYASYQWSTDPPVFFGINSPNEIFVNGSAITPGTTLFVYVTVTTSDGCTVSAKYEVPPCCTNTIVIDPDWYDTDPCSTDPISAYLGTSWQGTITGPQTISGRTIVLEHDLVIDQTNLVFDACTFYISGGVKITLDPGITIDFTNSTFNPSCDQMWDGIYTSHASNQFSFIKCGFFQAENAIVAENGSAGTVQISNFENCHTGMIIQDFAGPGSLPVSIYEQNTFQQTGTLLAPYLNERSFAGIELNAVNNLTIGQINTTENTFSNLDYGIYAENSTFSIVNNKFTLINQAANSQPCTTCRCPVGTAVCSNVSGMSTLPLVTVGGNSIAEQNRFQLNNNGLITFGNQNVTVKNNSFKNHQEAIGIYRSTKANIEISTNNDFFRYRFGTGIYNCFNSVVKIQNNTYNFTNFTLAGQATSAIYINNFSLGNVKLTLEGNSINRSRNGIWLIQVYGLDINTNTVAQVKNNTIDFTNLANNNFGLAGIIHTGVRIEASPFISVNTNNINKPGSTPLASSLNRIRGIWMLNSPYATVYENNITNISQGIYVAGNNFPSYYFCNDLTKAFRGFEFAGPASLGNQVEFSPNTPTPTNNGWYQRPTGSSDLSGQIFPPIHWYYTGSGAALPSTATIIPLSLLNGLAGDLPSYTNNVNTFCSIPQFQGPGNGNREMLFGQTVRNEITYSVEQSHFKFREEEIAIYSLLKDSSLIYAGLADDTLYESFVQSRLNLNQGKFSSFYAEFEKGNYVIADQHLQSITPIEIHENYFVLVNQKLNSHFLSDSVLPSSDSTDLFTIALESSFLNGTPIHQARAILKLDLDDPFSTQFRNAEPIATEDVIDETIIVYPNPNSGTFTIDASDEINSVSIFTVDGKLAYQSPVNNNNYLRLSLDLIPGYYLLEIHFTNGKSVNNKLSISK